ncbi:DUF2752 domain-containing protein [Peterkaempfera griseoplana]|uniref:DUF2752 domain-containing protein n=1 Tax=Peterkaempfera griseoplana TaxID=66896 RepID=UPI0006E3A876|nr:DUF2752 domain-containing protein [Peterkaempfera griseoplana]
MSAPAPPSVNTAPVRWWSRAAGSRYGGPLQVLVRAAGAAAAALAVSRLHRAHDPGALCLLRRFTGVPCPACGSTTVFIEAGQGHWTAALTANPFTVVIGLCLLLAPLGLGRHWWSAPVRRRNALIGTVAALSWCWQLHRYGFLLS